MNPVIPAPLPIPLPAPAWLLQLLQVFTFVLHVLPMSLLLGGSILLAISSVRGRRDPLHRELAGRASQVMPPVVAFTITFGVAPLLFLQLSYGQLFFTSSVLMAWVWLAVVLLVMLGYYGVYWFNMQQEELGKRAPWVMVATATLFLIVMMIFVQNMVFMLKPAEFYPQFLMRPVGNFTGIWDANTILRMLHMLTGALAVAGLGLALLSGAWKKQQPEWAAWARRYGVTWFVVATLVQFIVGAFFLFSLPPEIRTMFLGGDRLSTALLVVAIVLALLAVVAARRSLLPATAALVGTISLMAVIRHLVRVAYLQPYFDPRALPVQGQWVVFTIFAVLLVAGLATVGWMLYVFLRPATAKVTTN